MIFNHILPFALAIGMTKQEFMHSKPNELKSYYRAYQLKKRMKDEEMWLQGAYFYDALQVALSHFGAGMAGKRSHESYIKQPFSFSEEDTQSKNGMEEVAVFEMKQRTKALKLQGLKESPI